jgi:hypothetical protein
MELQNRKRLIYLVMMALVVLFIPSTAGTQAHLTNTNESAQDVLNKIELGIQRNNVDLIARNFLQQLSLSLPGAESGIYSTNQAISILQNYFDNTRIISFKFTTTHNGGETPYATGGGSYISRGKKDSFQVYTALRRVHGTWIITQFNIY